MRVVLTFLASHSNWVYKSKLLRQLEAYLFTYLLGIVTHYDVIYLRNFADD